ncbi:MAG: 4-hydroxy-tetrahydrodipicolinate reductase [Bacteroidota bacterium]
MNIALIGYGNMGHEVESVARQQGHTITVRFSSAHPLPHSDSEFYRTTPIDCFIDFSTASAVQKNVETAVQLHIPIVEGTTGWSEQQSEVIQRVRKANGSLVYGNNFSIGAQIFFRIVRTTAHLLNPFPQYDVGILEMHHTKKKDAPSGTALTLGNILLSNFQRKTALRTSLHESPLQPNEIAVSSSRVGTVVGIHTVLFNSTVDEIELTHRAHSRSGYAQGAVLAAELLVKNRGVYSFEELIFEHSLPHS